MLCQKNLIFRKVVIRTALTKLTDLNYLGWVYNVKQILKEHKVWSIVNGQETLPTIETKPGSSKGKEELGVTDPAVVMWIGRQETAMRIISLTIEDRQREPIRSTEDPKEAWDILDRLHAGKGLQRKLNLSRKLHNLRKSSTTTLTDHENSFRDTLEQLSAIGKVFDLEDLIIIYLRSLSEEYHNFAGMLEMFMEGMTLEDVMAKVQNEKEDGTRGGFIICSSANGRGKSSELLRRQTLWQILGQIQVSERHELSLLRQRRSH